ncbi:glycosyltransferase family A protein [Mangrovibacter phragmitis]|uniref:glycosyltransferase family A protein n=1 Tax=Mangrovibacter phragmitis TaxID=1691903 RepID=UPI00336AC1A9
MKSSAELISGRHLLDKSHIKLSYITHFYCNQNSIDSVVSLLREYEKFPADIIDAIEFVIVDDGSPLEYQIPTLNLNYRWLKITTDIQWNQGGARNLAVTYAKSDKILMTDLDHACPAETLRYLIKTSNPGRKFYKLRRKDVHGKIYNGHSNIFFMSRARFLRFYGYDEEYCGHYGAEDYRFVKFQKYHGSKQSYLPSSVWCYSRELDREGAYHSLKRDLSFNTPVDKRKQNECELFGAEYGHSRIFLNFEWKVLSSGTRQPSALPVIRRYWKLSWWWRWLNPFAAK